MKQTAVEWFLTEFQKQVWFEPDSELDIWIKDLIPKAIQIEKKQLCYFYVKGAEAEINNPYVTNIEFYNKTFKKI
jgi:hypothetical protein